MAQILNILFHQYYKNVQWDLRLHSHYNHRSCYSTPYRWVRAIQVVKNVHLNCIQDTRMVENPKTMFEKWNFCQKKNWDFAQPPPANCKSRTKYLLSFWKIFDRAQNSRWRCCLCASCTVGISCKQNVYKLCQCHCCSQKSCRARDVAEYCSITNNSSVTRHSQFLPTTAIILSRF